MTHVDFQVKYLDMLNEYIAASQNVYGSLLDERSLKEINEEESSVEKMQKKKENEEF